MYVSRQANNVDTDIKRLLGPESVINYHIICLLPANILDIS